MSSLKEALAAAGVGIPFSLRGDFEIHPPSLREIMRILRLPPMRLDAGGYEEIWEKSGQDAQGIACIDPNVGVITIAKKLLFARTTDVPFEKIEMSFDVPHFSRQTIPQLSGCDHFSDPDFRDGLLFFVLEVENRAGALFACDLNFNVVGFTEIEAEASNACCAFHPWNGRLYLKDSTSPGRRLRAYNVDEYFRRHKSGSSSDWGTPIEIVHEEGRDIVLRDGRGRPTTVPGDIQGIAFSPNGRIYLTHWRSYRNIIGTFFRNYLSIFDALTGRRMWFSGEIDFRGDGDEIEGISLVVPRGEIFFVQTDNDLKVDEFRLHRMRPSGAMVEEGGGHVEQVI
jgi:hypothetical protein